MNILQIPGLIIEPLLFTAILYWLAGLRDNIETFGFTLLVLLLTINVSTACGKILLQQFLYNQKMNNKNRM